MTNPYNFPEAEERDEAVKTEVVFPALQSRFLQGWKKGSWLTELSSPNQWEVIQAAFQQHGKTLKIYLVPLKRMFLGQNKFLLCFLYHLDCL